MAAISGAPRQFKQPSRKGKKAWRKNVDVTEVQDGLEVVRQEVISGGVIAEKQSEDLFTVDTTASESIQNSYLKKHKPLKADQILAQRSFIPAVSTRKRPGGPNTTDGILEPRTKKRKGISHNELQRLRDIALGGRLSVKTLVEESGPPDHDPWEENELVANAYQDPQFSFLEPPKPIREPTTLKRSPISLAVNGKPIPAVEKPVRGASYNPDYIDYVTLLEEEGEKAVEAEKKRIAQLEAEKALIARQEAAAEEMEKDALVEGEDEESAWEGLSEPESQGEWLNRKRSERKSQTQRNKIKRRKVAERKAIEEMNNKARKAELTRIKEYAAAAREKEMAQLALASEKSSDEEEGDAKLLRRRKFGKAPLPEPPLELVLPDELRDSLRLLKPEGNLLKERFRSILVRGKMETRRPIVQAKKRKQEATEKWTYKDWTLRG